MRNAAHTLVLVLLASGFGITPDTFLCLGPHNHCHLEVVIGTSCQNNPDDLRLRDHPAPKPADGCPRGSKDFRLSIDSHRTDNSQLFAPQAAATLIVVSRLIDSAQIWSLRVSALRSPAFEKSHYSTTVLRC